MLKEEILKPGQANNSRLRQKVCRSRIASITMVLCLAFPAGGLGQERIDPMAATVAERFKMIEQSFVALADAMPAERYAFRPADGEFKDVRTFGEHVKHVACSNFAFFNEIEKKEPPRGCGGGGPNPATTKTELMSYLRESFAYAGRVLGMMTPALATPTSGLAKSWPLNNSGSSIAFARA